MENKETPKREINRLAQIERSIIKKYRKSIWAKFVQAIDEYQLIQENDKIAVCISGGKDSMLMAKLFQELQKHWVIKFEAIFLVMDPGYNEVNRKKIEENAERIQQLTEENLLAAEVTGDGKVSFMDLIKVNSFRLHKIEEL